MVYHERSAWAGLIGTVVSVTLYVTLLLGSRADDITQTPWLVHMLWAIGVGIVLSIVITISWSLIANRSDPGTASASDIRDTDISRMGARVEYAFVVIAGLAVIALCAWEVDVFWIAQTMFAGFAISSFIGGIARVIAYRKGLA